MSAEHSPEHGHNKNATLQARVNRLLEIAERHGLTTPAAVDERVDAFLSKTSPENGSRVVARAWLDAGFADRLRDDATTAVQELGFSGGHQSDMRLRAVFNSPTQHNVIVCTLCSCYPLTLMGPPPPWYKAEAYRSRVVHDPRGVLGEFGLDIPESVEVRVWDSTADVRYIVIPERPIGSEGLDEESLMALVTRNCLIGTGFPTTGRRP
ncbi:nitrile hydratase subunit alpha [Streptosporangium sp. KLBMP 9127]|nr:nitrile hydratase subunit alpha [Streptosporangium sp. KLBMP 9127]